MSITKDRRYNSGRRVNDPARTDQTVVPAFVIEERERRILAEHRDVTAVLCGDPRPGYSMLDRKRAGA